MRARGRLAGAALLLAAAAARATEPPATYRVDYVVTIAADDPGHAHVRWELAGIDEIAWFRLGFRDDRTTDVRATGSLTWSGRTATWRPGGPYAHLAYTVAIDRRRPADGPRFDSHAAPTWIATRAACLFPRIDVEFRGTAVQARSDARLVFRLPPGWRSAAIGERLGPHVYRVAERGRRLDRPRGWYLLGDTHDFVREIAGTGVTVAVAPDSPLDVRRLLALYVPTIPRLAEVLGPPPPRLLLVSAPDPMWRGGLSGEESLFVHGGIPIRSPDQTSTYLHELFHVWAPFRVGDDGHWVSEGLAEYYSLALAHRTGRLSDDRFRRGVALFAKYGRWGVDLTHTRSPAALNDSAPFVMRFLDRTIAEATGGRANLDDAVRALIRSGDVVTTAAWLRATSAAAGRDLAPLFARHVRGGAMPPVSLDDAAS